MVNLEVDGAFSIVNVECIKASVISTFGSIIGEPPVFTGFEEKHPDFTGVVGIISLLGGISWSLMLEIPKVTALPLALKFAGFEIEYDSEDMGDVVGELANVFAGDSVSRLDAVGVKVNMSLPTIARGSGMQLTVPEKFPLLRMKFTSLEGEFWIKIAQEDR